MSHEIVITATAALTPYGLNVSDTVHGLNNGSAVCFDESEEMGTYTGMPIKVAPIPDYNVREMLATRSISSYDRLTRHLLVAVDQLHHDLDFSDHVSRQELAIDERVALVLGSSGSVQSVTDYDLQAIREPQYVQPGLFPNCVFNVPASYAAIRRSIKGSCITLTDGDVSSLVALTVAMRQLRSGRMDLVFAGGAEELTPAYALHRTAQAAKYHEPSPSISETAVLFALEPIEAAEKRNRCPLAVIKAAAHVYYPEPQAGLHACLAELQRQVGKDVSDVKWLYAEDGIDTDILGLAARKLQLKDKLGHCGAVYGAAAVLAGLSHPDILPGDTVLVLSTDPNGACAALLFEKKSYVQ